MSRAVLAPYVWLRFLVGMTYLAVTAWSGILYLQFPLQLLLSPFSVPLAAKTSDWVVGGWWSLTVTYIEKFNGTKIHFLGDPVPNDENCIFISNHICAVDWMFAWCLAIRKGCLGRIKNVLKSSLMILPVFGWAFKMAKFLPLDRKWARDDSCIDRHMEYLVHHNLPIWLLLYPEGTRYCEKKKKICQDFARAHGLPVLNHILTPRTRGWVACAKGLRNRATAVYDVTMAYDPAAIPVGSTFVALLGGTFPKQAFVHVKRYEMSALPKDQEGLERWCLDRFSEKDESLASFYANGKLLHDGKPAPEVLEAPLPWTTVFMSVTFWTLWASFIVYLNYTYYWARVYNLTSCVLLFAYTSYSPIVGLLSKKKRE